MRCNFKDEPPGSTEETKESAPRQDEADSEMRRDRMKQRKFDDIFDDLPDETQKYFNEVDLSANVIIL